MSTKKWALSIWTSVLYSTLAGPAMADCSALPNWQGLKTALANVVAAGGNGGLGLNMWGTLGATDGTVCALAFSGNQYVYQWVGSGGISAPKGDTPKAFCFGKGSRPAPKAVWGDGLALRQRRL